MKIVLGKKSHEHMLYFGLMTIIPLGILSFLVVRTFVFESQKDDGIYIILLGILLVYGSIGFIKALLMPMFLIESDHLYLYLNYQGYTKKIELSNIKEVKPRRYRMRRGSFSFGTITLYEKSQIYTIGYVSQCEQVALNIMKKANEHNGIREYNDHFNIDTNLV